MINEQEYERLRDRLYRLQAQVDYLYKHLGISFSPDLSMDDPRIIEKLQKGDILGAMKVHRELFNSDVRTAQDAVLELKGRMGI